jgi:tRNA pseudouridine55 synthase
MDGLIPVDKPAGWTSHDVVQKIRSCLGESRVGHFGTLDPLATGLLLVAVGRATRFFPFYSRTDKRYRGRMRLGLSTDTYDVTGKPQGPECFAMPSPEALAEAMARLTGPLLQTPPSFSAKKIGGRPSYELARSNRPISLKPEQVTVHSFSLEAFRPPRADFSVACSSGTYVRALVHDLGADLGCGAHLESLIRLSSGEHTLEDAFRLEDIERWAGLGEHGRFLLPLKSLLPGFPALRLTESGFRSARNGQSLSPADVEDFPRPAEPGNYRLFGPGGALAAVARLEAGTSTLVPFLVLA